MKNLFKSLFSNSSVETLEARDVDPDVLVKQIHQEVDDLESISIKQVEQLLAELQIPTENQVTNKADLMKSLGFSSSNETIKQSDSIKEDIIQKKAIKKENDEKLQLINQYRLSYPADKIIPLSEFKKVLEKYNLIYAPSSAYIKDVPEKNLLEISRAMTVREEHIPEDTLILDKVSFMSSHNDTYRKYFTNLLKDSNILNKIVNYHVFSESKTRKFFIEIDSIYANVKETGHHKYYFNDITAKSISSKGLFIAAPTSHFDLTNLDKSGDYQYSTSKTIKINDPIAFYMLKGPKSNIEDKYVRIVSKWGTSDDQSYLDPIVQNENLN